MNDPTSSFALQLHLNFLTTKTTVKEQLSPCSARPIPAQGEGVEWGSLTFLTYIYHKVGHNNLTLIWQLWWTFVTLIMQRSPFAQGSCALTHILVV